MSLILTFSAQLKQCGVNAVGIKLAFTVQTIMKSKLRKTRELETKVL